MLDPGVYDVTPENTGYDKMAHRCRVTVYEDGTGFQEAITTPQTTAVTHDPDRCFVLTDTLSIPADITSLGVTAFYRPSKFFGVGMPHMFDVLHWRSQDGDIVRPVRHMPGVSIILASEITVEDMIRGGLY